MSADDCPHGIPHEQRKRDGCDKCDTQALEAIRAEREAAKIRARAVGTARELFIGCLVKIQPLDLRTNSDGYIEWALHYAAEFERAADAYLKDGGAK